MYFLSVLLLMLVFPILSIAAEHFFSHGTSPLLLLAGKWFVFWGAGVRLFLAGLRQFFQPRFTAKEIFAITSDDPLPIVRELGVANFATGTVGILSLLRPTFVFPIAIVALLFYGVAGIRHASDEHRNSRQNFAMITDIFACFVFIAYVAYVTLF